LNWLFDCFYTFKYVYYYYYYFLEVEMMVWYCSEEYLLLLLVKSFFVNCSRFIVLVFKTCTDLLQLDLIWSNLIWSVMVNYRWEILHCTLGFSILDVSNEKSPSKNVFWFLQFFMLKKTLLRCCYCCCCCCCCCFCFFSLFPCE
jgi:hypothetical protein